MEFRCSSEASHMGCGTYPRATRLQDGSILGTHTEFHNGQNVIVTTKSTDDGVTWVPHGEVARGFGDVDNPFVLQRLDGNILCAFRNHTTNASGGNIHHRITICVSKDSGKEWKYLSTPEESPNPVRGLWEPFLRLAGDGSLQLYYSKELSPRDQDSILRISHDGGKTWGEAITFTGHDLVTRDGMLGIAELDGDLVAVFETDEDGIMHIKCVTSADDGKTWGNRQLVYRAGKWVAAAPQIANIGGVLVVTFQTDEDGEGMGLKCMVGTPGNWGLKAKLGCVGVWSGIMALDEKNALVMFDENGTCKARKITLKR
ncbi:glycoside hydrolase family 93 protein [Stipitochalara longipes BDJ]|nr:glycoside hydrolase family 93 protein [Stipitochalara longipes BDJ]